MPGASSGTVNIAAAPELNGSVNVFSYVNGFERGQELFSNNSWGPEVSMPNSNNLATAISATADAFDVDQVFTVFGGVQFYQIGTWEGGWGTQSQVL